MKGWMEGGRAGGRADGSEKERKRPLQGIHWHTYAEPILIVREGRLSTREARPLPWEQARLRIRRIIATI